MMTLNTMNAVAVASATGTATQQFAAVVRRNLCKPVCVNQTIQPTENITFSIINQETIGTTTFVRILASGTISYVPKNGCACNTITQSFAEQMTVVFANAAATSAPAVSLIQGTTDGYLVDVRCTTAHAYETATPVTISASYA